MTPLTIQTDRLDTSVCLGSSMDVDNHHLRPEAIEARREDLERGAGESLSIVLDLVFAGGYRDGVLYIIMELEL